jgi:DNA repair exonuclease SbcCD ATPase subunit
MAKTVEEILKEEGVIQPVPEQSKEERPKEEKPDLTRMIINIEKLQTEVNTIKDFKKQNDEVLRELTEKIGEIRSLFFQRESLIKETETKVKTLDDIVSDISPSKYMREMESRKKEVLDVQARMEKFELIGRGLTNDTNNLKQTLQNIKSVENLEKVLNEIQNNVSKNRELKADIEREAGKTERFYLEMENRMKEFLEIKERINKTEDLAKELIRSMDVINIRLTGVISKSDIEDFKKSVNNDINASKQYIDTKLKEVENFLNLPSQEIGSRLEQLKKRRDDTSKFLINLEDQYKKATVSEKTYIEVKQQNENLLKQIGEELSQLQTGQTLSFRNLPSIISTLDVRTNNLEKRMDDERSIIDESLKNVLSNSKISNIAEVVRTQTNMLNEVVNKMKEINDKLTTLSNAVGSFESRIRFFEILDGLIRMDNSKDINFYLTELEKLALSMKSSGLWDNNRQSLTLNLLRDISENWKKYGYEDIAQVLDNEIAKIKSMETHNYMLKY